MMRIFRHIVPSSTDTVLAIGNFDGVHLGHQAILARLRERARATGRIPGVMTFEPHPREFFTPAAAPARLTSLREKMELFEQAGVAVVYLLRFDHRLAALGAMDFLERLLRPLRTKEVLVGKDFRFGAGRTGDLDTLRTVGLDVEILPDVLLDGVRVSSTLVREALATGELDLASRLLGRPYSLSGLVVHGDKLGRQLGYPTANVHMLHDHPPLLGIYAVKLVGVADQALPGVASLGVRPTMKHDGRPTLEVHLFDFDRDIYGRHVQVQFLHKIRDEARFPDLEALKRQIAADELAARNYFKMHS